MDDHKYNNDNDFIDVPRGACPQLIGETLNT